MTGLAEVVLSLFLGALIGGVIGDERYTHRWCRSRNLKRNRSLIWKPIYNKDFRRIEGGIRQKYAKVSINP